MMFSAGFTANTESMDVLTDQYSHVYFQKYKAFRITNSSFSLKLFYFDVESRISI